ncbi:protein NETWORKED 4A-like [Euphorbia lathyris]|uniref:protein NETWORKED 4A-like n=1 Tax=Euphorbia lathyris TaxID=212925 RepID=UPI003313B790
MDQSVNAILKMIEQNGASLAKKAELCRDTRPDLIGEIEEFYSLYRSLAERYDHLNSELYKSIPLEFQSQDAGSAPNTPIVTPDQKLGLHKTGHQVASLSSGTASSDHSLKDGSDSSSSSSSDSESESFNSSGNAYYSLPVNTDHKRLHQKIIELGPDLPRMEGKLQSDSEDNGDSAFDAAGNGNYEELLGRMMRYEEELRDSKLKLKLSEDEIARLQNELERSNSFMILSEVLHGELESANQNIRMREADLEAERRRRTVELKEMADAANHVERHFKTAQEEIIMLNSKLESESEKCLDLQERFARLENDLLERDDDVKALNFALTNAEENFLAEKSHLSERNSLLDARIEEWELHSKSLEGKLRKCETEKMEFQLSLDTQLQGLQGEINQLRVELGDKSETVEILNKMLDTFKFKYDMLMAEKDEMKAKVNTLIAEVSSRDNRIGQMEENIRQEQMKNAELIAGSESFQKLEHELRMRIVELEREVDKQRGELSAGAEEKREAIRQLCFSLEYYRTEYKELCQAFGQQKRHKRNAVMAS